MNANTRYPVVGSEKILHARCPACLTSARVSAFCFGKFQWKVDMSRNIRFSGSVPTAVSLVCLAFLRVSTVSTVDRNAHYVDTDNCT